MVVLGPLGVLLKEHVLVGVVARGVEETGLGGRKVRRVVIQAQEVGSA